MTAFDYIVVGAGSAGCVIANRLSADPSIQVALIEAGESDRAFPLNAKTSLPVGNIFLLSDPRYNWQYRMEGGPGTQDRELPCPRGKLLGGCSSVNGTVYIRGHASDYDDWAALGNTGWSYADVLPAYLRHEHRHGSASPLHGSQGELHVQRPKANHPLAHAFVAAATEAGHVRNDDFNGASQDGFGLYELNQHNGVRQSSSRAFLHPVLHRSNLTVLTDTRVERLLFSGSRAEGMTVLHRGERRALRASREVILAGGTISSAHLLLLSGIGPQPQLRQFGIPVIRELPGVGGNLQDHPTIFLAVEDPSGETYALSARSLPRVLLSPLSYLAQRRGMLASNAAEAGGFLRTLPELARPDVQMTLLVGLKDNARTIPRRHGYVLLVQLLRPLSRGSLELASADPLAAPRIRANFLEHTQDLETLVRGLQAARRIVASPALTRYSGHEIEPGPQVSTSGDIEAAIRRQVLTAYHPVGTCKMGPASDPFAVVDPQLRVHGIDGLRVADASIMPTIIGGNTSAPAMMIGERCAEFILRPAAQPATAPSSADSLAFA
ncbi:MAG: GMC family oxidoreductase N-terminal domain-containing protein [Pigmentiphaga sp.]|nr:GMC family oxidoreductase N-terminal domain-containing protein [Pigmentiphaga sp.]